MKIITKTEKETFDLAKNFAKTLKGGEVIGLAGDLGAGKTVFTKGLAAGLGLKQTVNSPTFVVMKIYPIKKHLSIKVLVHIDAYRIKQIEEINSIGISDYLNRPDTVVVIEWADKIEKILLKNYMNVRIINIEENIRIINY